jgi:hypothetical protein
MMRYALCRRRFIIGVGLLLLISMLANPGAPTSVAAQVPPITRASAPTTTYYGLIVGVADYPGTVNDLRFTDDDAREIRTALLRYGNWQEANVQLLLDAAATKSAIQAAIGQIGAVADADDVVLFFFSGHGTFGSDVAPLDEGDGSDEYLCAYGSTLTSFIRDDELSDWLGSLPTTNVVVALDTCHSGGQIKAPGGVVRSLPGTPTGMVQRGDGFAADLSPRLAPRDMDDNPGGVVLTAADDDEYSYEFVFLRNGLFSYFLIGGLEQYADRDGDGELSAEELFLFAWLRVRILDRRMGLGQHPQLLDDYPAADPSTEQLAVGIGPPSGSLPAAHDDSVLKAR